MPGPIGGGGRRGGGGFGGGFRGGFRGGPHFGFWGFGPRYRRYGYGGGCLGSLAGIFILPIIIAVFAVMILLSSFSQAFSSVFQGGTVNYNEEVFQDYANAQYQAEFGNAGGYEDNILLIFLTAEDNYDYCYIAWVGDHVPTPTQNAFNTQGSFGVMVNNCINSANYKYSLDSDIARIVVAMKNLVASDSVDEFSCDCEREGTSHLTNKSELELTPSTVNNALEDFTDTTGIPIVVVVDEMEDVFGRSMSTGSVITVVIGVGLIILAIWLIYRGFKNRNNDDNGRDYDRSRYEGER